MMPIVRRDLLAGLAAAGTLLSAPALAVPDPGSAFGPPPNLRCMIAHLDPEELDRITGNLRARGHALRDCAFVGDLRSALIIMRQYRLRLVYMHRQFGDEDGLRLSDALHLARENLLRGHILWSGEQGADITITRSGPYAVLGVTRRPGLRSEDLVRLSLRARRAGGRLEFSEGPPMHVRFVPGLSASAREFW